MRPAIRPVPAGAGDVDLSVLAARVAVAPGMATIAAVVDGTGMIVRWVVDVTTGVDVRAATAAGAVGVMIAPQGGAATDTDAETPTDEPAAEAESEETEKPTTPETASTQPERPSTSHPAPEGVDIDDLANKNAAPDWE